MADVPPLNGSTLTVEPTGSILLRAPAAPWTYAVLVPLDLPVDRDAGVIGLQVAIELEVLEGTVGLFVTDQHAQAVIGQERLVSAGRGRITVDIPAGATGTVLCCRAAQTGHGLVRIDGVRTTPRRTFDITSQIDQLLPALLRRPGPDALAAVAAVLSSTLGRVVDVPEIGALACTRVPLPLLFDQVFDDPLGRLILDDVRALVALLPSYDPDKVDRRSGFLGRDYFEAYFRQSAIRVYHLVQLFRELGFTSGRVLEMGSLCGQFALTLTRLGYEVTAIDRYRVYRGAFDGYTAFLREAGVHVIETDREDEGRVLAALGQFDAVMAMAVIEHIPHTPREFIGLMAAHVRQSGVIALDTPNLARERNRRLLSQGSSIHQAIEDQYYTSIPWEGHHREYTVAEMDWILRQAGCSDVRTRLFDYNLLQFNELSSEHLDALLRMTIDPALADMVLAAGRLDRPARERPPT